MDIDTKLTANIQSQGVYGEVDRSKSLMLMGIAALLNRHTDMNEVLAENAKLREDVASWESSYKSVMEGRADLRDDIQARDNEITALHGAVDTIGVALDRSEKLVIATNHKMRASQGEIDELNVFVDNLRDCITALLEHIKIDVSEPGFVSSRGP